MVDASSITIMPGALPICKPAISATWKLCNATVAEGVGMVMLDMPEATSVTITGKPKIAKAGDGATYSPFDVADSVEFDVMLFFEDAV